MKRRFAMVIVLGAQFAWARPAFAQQPVEFYSPTSLMVTLALLGLLPFFLVMVTSFVKIAVVLSILRNAVGMPQIPPNQVITGLTIVLSLFVMLPVATQVYDRARASYEDDKSLLSIEGVLNEDNRDTWTDITEPLKKFLNTHASAGERELFWSLANRFQASTDAPVTLQDFRVLIPAFVVTELKEAFLIGFVIFLPFLVVDMIVANVLMALGMFMLSPTTISLPIKLLVFVMVDGWYLVTRGLVTSYLAGG